MDEVGAEGVVGGVEGLDECEEEETNQWKHI